MYSQEYTYDTYQNIVITKYQILITNPPGPDNEHVARSGEHARDGHRQVLRVHPIRMMDIPTIQAETAISDFMETPLSLHHSGICPLSSSLSTLTSSSPSRREAETGIWKLLPTPVQSFWRAALESGSWNLESDPSPPGQERNLESGIWNLPRPPRPPLGEWVLESGIWKLPCWNLLADEGPEAAKLESGNCLRDLEHEINR